MCVRSIDKLGKGCPARYEKGATGERGRGDEKEARATDDDVDDGAVA